MLITFNKCSFFSLQLLSAELELFMAQLALEFVEIYGHRRPQAVSYGSYCRGWDDHRIGRICIVYCGSSCSDHSVDRSPELRTKVIEVRTFVRRCELFAIFWLLLRLLLRAAENGSERSGKLFSLVELCPRYGGAARLSPRYGRAARVRGRPSWR